MDAAKIPELERLLLPEGCHFAEDAKSVIDCWESVDVLACPGSGKTTVLMAKLQHLADKMPLPQGRGICILSHTNVAVDEIKKRLTGDAAAKILNYPNFAGTIQSFVDTFVVFPFLRSRVRSSIRLVSRESYAKEAWELIGFSDAYAVLKTLVSQRYGQFKCESETKFIEGMRLDDNDNLYFNKTLLASAAKMAAKKFKSLVSKLLTANGLMTYEMVYDAAFGILAKHGELIRPAISRRFQYVFVDEYQDCSPAQRNLFAALFDGMDTVIQRIGDLDQAIYNSVNSSLGADWDVSGSRLEIAETNRYGEEIARVVSKLRTGQKEIISHRGRRNRKPVLFVYEEGKEKHVVKAFVEEIVNEGLDSKGVFKAVGMVSKGTGTTILDYWDSFSDDVLPNSQDGWVHYRQEIVRQLAIGRLYKVAQIVDELLVLISRRHNIRTEANGFYTKTRVRMMVADKVDDEYREGVLRLASECASEPDKIEDHILALLALLCQRVFPGVWTAEGLRLDLAMPNGSQARREPIPFSRDDGITVSISTIHKVKGENHDATLYLETEHKRNSDLRRIMPLFAGKALPEKEIVERSRRCAYVGMSRPRHMLCVAMKAKTYEGHESCFESDWKVVKIQ